MTTPLSRLLPFASALIIAGALVYVRLISADFSPNLKTQSHPVTALTICLLLAGAAWIGLVFYFRRKLSHSAWLFPLLILGGLALRLSFFDSQPIYENDYKRYLWDGAVTATGSNPYEYSPKEIYQASRPGAASVPKLARLAVLSNQADELTDEINSSTLTTIYPPAAQAVFAGAYVIAPFDPNGLRGAFLLLELLGFFILLFALKRFGKPIEWAALYWLNPIIILSTYNGIHMDVLLVLPLWLALLFIKKRPTLSAVALSLAATIKIWPLLLAPILFRDWFRHRLKYIGIAALVAVLTGLSLLPMLLSLKEQSGLAAYSANWTNSSFLFPLIRDGLALFAEDPNRLARYVIAALLVGLSLSLGFLKSRKPDDIPLDLMALSVAFVLLSPTGYPWYFIWFYLFLPFVLKSWMARGVSLLTLGATSYYIRFLLGESGRYDIYTHILLPLEFGIPILILAWDGWKAKRHA